MVRARVGDVDLQTLPYGEATTHNGVRISFHPAGHVPGSAQIRLEHDGRVWVASGDYKTGSDATCAPFEPVRCDVFVTESTFGLPVFRWAPQQDVFDSINAWWQANAQVGRASIVYLYAYSFGKAQRVLSCARTWRCCGRAAFRGRITCGSSSGRAATRPSPST